MSYTTPYLTFLVNLFSLVDKGYSSIFVSMLESMHQKFLLKSKVIRNIGIVLFVLSFFAPLRWDDLRFFGGGIIFVATPDFAITEISAKPSEELSHSTLLFCIMMTAWLANFTVFFRLPLVIAIIAILLPWPAYIYLFSDLVHMIPFYPWAIGIALIHVSRFPKSWPKTLEPKPSD